MTVSTYQLKGLRGRRLSGTLLNRRLCYCIAVWMLAVAALARATPVGAEEPPTYLIGPGDQLLITVWREDELTTSATVRPDGRISVPLVEDLLAVGKTPPELADDITERLSQYLNNPMVSVAVQSGAGDLRQQIRVVGEAARPTTLAYRDGITLLDAITSVGGLSREADGNGAVIVRVVDGNRQEIPVRLADLVRSGDPSANEPLLPGDVIVIPEGFLNGEWTVLYSANASQTFSDNIDLGDDGDREFGTVTRAGPGVSVQGNTARVRASLNANISGVTQFGGNDEGFSVDPSIAGTSTTELSPGLLFFDLNAAVSRQLLDSRDGSSAGGGSTENTEIVATLTASPYLVHRLADFADVEWRYRISPVLVDSGGDGDVLDHEGSLTLRSGDDFTVVDWTLANRVGQEVRSDDDISTASTDLDVAYQIVRGFSLLGAVGYEYRDGDDNNDNNFNGVTWRSGFRWEPSPNLTAEATYGRRDDDESIDASLAYQVGPRTSLRASYSEDLETSQGRAISNLDQIGIDPDTGGVTGGGAGGEFDADNGPFTFDDETRRVKTFNLNADHNSGRNSFGLNGLVGSSTDGNDGDEDFYRAGVTYGRVLSQQLSLNTGASYDRSEFDEDNRTDDTYRANVGLNYSLTSNAQASVSYFFQKRDSNLDNQSFFENAVTLGIGVTF